jgi:hypothetical protein
MTKHINFNCACAKERDEIQDVSLQAQIFPLCGVMKMLAEEKQ